MDFMWNGKEGEEKYNQFNDGGWVTRDPTVIIVCTVLSVISTIAFGGWFCFKFDDSTARMMLFVGSLIMLVVAIIFVIGGVWVMIADIALMGYYSWVTWQHYQQGLDIMANTVSKVELSGV